MYDVIVIGAGPAGLMAAAKASEQYKVLLLEKNSKAGRKLLLTGNGRCNVINLKENRDFLDIIEYNKKHLYGVINRFGPNDLYDFFVEAGVPLVEEKDNNIFPASNKAQDILNVLHQKSKKADKKYNEEVIKIKIGKEYTVVTNNATHTAPNVIIATGGASFPKTGSTGDHMTFAKQLEQPTIPLHPAEVGVILSKKTSLAGTSFEEVEVTCGKKQTYGHLIFTHQGLSGRSIMDMSGYISKENKKSLTIDFLPHTSNEEIHNHILSYNREATIKTCLQDFFTKRFCDDLVDVLGENKKIKSLQKKDIEDILTLCKVREYAIAGVDALERAYVTTGGIDMKYVNSKTMESTIHKGIYFVGEALDIHGPIGGYNITLALSTGHLAGESIEV